MVRKGPLSGAAPFALILAGPTAVGKSAEAIALARTLGGEVISLDSVQVYRGCDIGSAKPTLAEREEVPHHLIDILEPDQRFDVGVCTKRARELVESVSSRGKLPIIVASSGMYLTALLHGLADAPGADEGFRQHSAGLATETLYAELQLKDPARAETLHPNDRVRIVRALEVLRSCGPLSELQAQHAHRHMLIRPLIFVLMRDRKDLYARIAGRVEAMLAAGLLAEATRLYERYADCWPLQSIGYRECVQHLKGNLPRGELFAAICQSTRRLAKRQITYLLNEPKKRGWLVQPAALTESNVVPLRVQHSGPMPVLSIDANQCLEMVELHRQSPPSTPELYYIESQRLSRN